MRLFSRREGRTVSHVIPCATYLDCLRHTPRMAQMAAPQSTTKSMETDTVKKRTKLASRWRSWARIRVQDPEKPLQSSTPPFPSRLLRLALLVNNTYSALFYTRAKIQPFSTNAASPNCRHSRHPRSPAPNPCPSREKGHGDRQGRG